MITDRLIYIGEYSMLTEYRKAILDFINQYKCERFPEGRYDLDDSRLYALVQTYESRPKADARMESHQKHADLQVILNGSELVYWAYTDELTITEDRLHQSDFVLYDKTTERGVFRLDAGMFAYFAPWDAHAPCIRCIEDRSEKIEKIVFKIRLKA